jgi:hypothetical protein
MPPHLPHLLRLLCPPYRINPPLLDEQEMGEKLGVTTICIQYLVNVLSYYSNKKFWYKL